MPFKSKKQQRWMFAAEARGELPPGTAQRWAEETPDLKDLPEQVAASRSKSRASSKSAESRRAELRPAAFRLYLLAKSAGDERLQASARTLFKLACLWSQGCSCQELAQRLGLSVKQASLSVWWLKCLRDGACVQKTAALPQASTNRQNPAGLNVLRPKQPNQYLAANPVTRVANPLSRALAVLRRRPSALPQLLRGMNAGGVKKP